MAARARRPERRTYQTGGLRAWRAEPWTGDGPEPTPRPCDTPRSPEAAAASSRLDCANRPWCLRRATVENWPGMECDGCASYAAPTSEDLAAERRILFALGRVLVGGVEAVEHPRGVPARPVR